MANKSNGKTNKTLMVGGLAALAAAAAGAFFLYGTEAGKKKRKQIKSWSLKAKADVLERMEKLKDINEEVYHRIVDEVAEKYKTLKEIDPQELGALVSELRGHWRNIKRNIAGGGKTSRRKK